MISVSTKPYINMEIKQGATPFLEEKGILLWIGSTSNTEWRKLTQQGWSTGWLCHRKESQSAASASACRRRRRCYGEKWGQRWLCRTRGWLRWVGEELPIADGSAEDKDSKFWCFCGVLHLLRKQNPSKSLQKSIGNEWREVFLERGRLCEELWGNQEKGVWGKQCESQHPPPRTWKGSKQA